MGKRNIDKISISTCALPGKFCAEWSFAEKMAMFRQAGYEYIEFSRSTAQALDVSEIRLAVRDNGLKVWSVHGIMHAGCISPDPAKRQAAVDQAAQFAEELAEYAPCPLVEHYLDRYNDPAPGRYFRESVEALYEKVSRMGYILCIETAPWKPWENERYPDTREVAEFVRSFGKADLQMTFDVNHSNIHETLEQAAENTAGLVKNIHVSDNHGEREEHLAPGLGLGIIDFAAAFRLLRENGYTGPCNLEFSFKDRAPTVESLAEVRINMEKLAFGRELSAGD